MACRVEAGRPLPAGAEVARRQHVPADAIRRAGYGIVANGQRSWNGVAILARGREPIETGRGVPGLADDPQSRYVEASSTAS